MFPSSFIASTFTLEEDAEEALSSPSKCVALIASAKFVERSAVTLNEGQAARLNRTHQKVVRLPESEWLRHRCVH